ncbi:hypothetical protein V2A60_001795 [Cordyceps javanica]
MAASPKRGHMLLPQGGTRKQQADRNLRKKLAEGKLSIAEQMEAAAAIEGLDPKQIATRSLQDLKNTTSANTAYPYAGAPTNTNPGQKSDRSQWSLLKKRQEGAGSESTPAGNARDADGSTMTPANTKWPLLKRRQPSYGYMTPTDLFSDTSKDFAVTAVLDQSTDLVIATHRVLAEKEDSSTAKSHTMLRIDGLSTNVHPSDFYRIAENDLSKWNQSITKVQQVRDRMTLEPTGTYHVSFSTAVAATAYAARFQRLHALARVRARSRTGLWRSEVPPALLQDDGGPATATQAGLEAELARLSVAAGVHDVTLAHRRVAAGPEANKIRGIVAGDGLGERPPVVLIDIAPAASLDRVRNAVRQHGQRARGSWGLARVHPVAANLHQQLQRLTEQAAAQRAALNENVGEEVEEQQQQQQQQQHAEESSIGVSSASSSNSSSSDEAVAARDESEKQLRAVLRKREGLRRIARHTEGAALRRFVVAFRDDAEAQRFHRLWNGRWLGGRDVPPAGGAARHFVRTQVLDY